MTHLSAENEILAKHFKEVKKYLDPLVLSNSSGTYLQNYLSMTYGPVFNYTEAIILLCENGKYNAAAALIRSIFEAHINIIYHQSGDSNKKLAISAKEQSDQKITIVTEIQQLIKDYPNQASSDPTNLFNETYLNDTYSDLISYKQNLIRSNNLGPEDKALRLKKKVEICDSESDTESGHFQGMYSLVYRYLSPFVHLDVQGLDAFVSTDPQGSHFFKETVSERTLITQSIAICICLAKDLYKSGSLTGDLPDIINEANNLLIKSGSIDS